MTSSILEAVTGETREVQTDARDGEVSYNTGGFSYTSRLGRVDTASAEIQSSSQSAKVTEITSDNVVVVQLFSQGTATAGDEGQEIDNDTRVSDNIHLEAYRL